MRKLISHAFSERALRDQEGFLQLYVEKFINGLRKNASNGPQDMVQWFNWATFDSEYLVQLSCSESSLLLAQPCPRIKSCIMLD